VPQATALVDECQNLLAKAVAHSQQHFEDLPEIRNWTWGA
jgi:phosphoketolase